MLAFIKLRITINSSFMFSLLESHTIPDMLKNLSIKELDAGIFNKITCKSNNFGMFVRYFNQNSLVEDFSSITLGFAKRADK